MAEQKKKTNEETEEMIKDPKVGDRTEKREIKYHLWIYIFSVINFMTLVLCILTGVFINSEDTPGIQDTELCLRCSQLKIHPDDQLQNVQVYEEDICCAKPGHLEDLIHDYTDVWFRKKRRDEHPEYKECRDDVEDTTRPAIKLIGAFKSPLESNGMKVHWDDTAFNRNTQLLVYSHGKVEVKKAGQYFIYLQIDFICGAMERFKATSAMSYNVMQVARLPKRASQEEVIMKHTSTPPDCYAEQGPANYTSYTGTSLHLFEGDYIYAKVFYWDTLRNHSSSSFFGMHKVE